MDIRRRIAALVLTLAGAAFPALAEEDLDVKPAMVAATAWLATVDGGRYGQSWEDAASYFRESVVKLRWEVAVQDVRGTVGALRSRKLRSANYARTVPGAPPGEYVVIEYDTVFENRPYSVETVTPMREKDGTWKVSGYFIR